MSQNRPRWKYIRNLTVFTLIASAIGMVVVLLSLSLLQAYSMTHPAPIPVTRTAAEAGLPTAQDVCFITGDDLRLEGWYVPPERDDGAAVLFVHGIGANRLNFMHIVDWFVDQGYGALLFDLRNHGNSEGDATTLSALEVLDVQAAYEALLAQPEVNEDRIALFGASMGAATAIRAAPELPGVRAVIAEASFTSIYDLLAEGIPATLSIPPLFFPDIIIGLGNQFSGANLYEASPIDAIPHVQQPILFIHGTEDSLIPYTHSERLFAAAGNPAALYLVEGADHIESYFLDPEAYKAQLRQFLEQHLQN